VELTNAARAAGRQLAISRTSTTPWTNATSEFYASTPNMTKANITITLSVNRGRLQQRFDVRYGPGYGAGRSLGADRHLPCNLDILNVNFVPGCTLSAQTTEQVE